MNKEEFISALKKLNIDLTEKQINQLEVYCQFLLEYNEHTNLTAIKKSDDVYLKHFYDSITIAKSIDLNNYHKLLDIGTGAGFPGMVLKIIYPHLEVTLLDSNNKKLKFLEELSKKLELKVELIHERAEVFIKNRREYYDIVTSRAVANLRVLSELAIPYVRVDGYFVAMKAVASEEIKESKDIIEKMSSTIEDINEFDLPIENSKRTIIKIRKNKITNLKYPRSYDKIVKNK